MRSQACVPCLSLAQVFTVYLLPLCHYTEANEPRIPKENVAPLMLVSELLHSNAEAKTKLQQAPGFLQAGSAEAAEGSKNLSTKQAALAQVFAKN